jgi:pimeloyl-ACP methyl ester carboxylesterase
LTTPVDLPWVRDSGTGPPVICLHSSASTSSQWRALTSQLAPKYRVLAPDLLGVGRSGAWPNDRPPTLHDEAARLEPVFAAAGAPCFLVGHSYGAAVALIAALSKPGRFAGLVLYEPTLFSVLGRGAEEAHGIEAVVADVVRSIAADDLAAAGERFIDYWTGAGSWRRMPDARRAAIGATMANAAHWARALFDETTPPQAFAALDVPVLYMVGAHSPPSTRGVARRLIPVLRQVSVIEFPGFGHMAPVTHPERVNDSIAAFLGGHLEARHHAGRWSPDGARARFAPGLERRPGAAYR